MAGSGAFEPLREYLDARAREELVPGVVAVVGRMSGRVASMAVGFRALAPRRERMTLHTIFDLASLTKPMVTGALASSLAAEGALSLEDPLERHLDELRGTPAGRPTLAMLLTHTSGFPPMNPLEDYAARKPELIQAIAREPLEAEPGARFQYSDVGYILFQCVLERLLAGRLDRLARERLFGPLMLRDTRYGIRAADRGRTAPTTRERGRWLLGRVHDPRARSPALGGVAGHAGVFGTGADVARYGSMLLRGGLDGKRRILSERAVALLTTNQLPDSLGVRRGFGFDIESPYSAPRGKRFSRDSYGHSGFTGVSMWIDPRNDAYFVLLTNSIHAGGHKDLKQFRAEAATLAAVGLGI